MPISGPPAPIWWEIVMIAMASPLPVPVPQRGRRDGDPLAGHVVEDVHLVGERAAGEDLEDVEHRLQRGARVLAHHPLHRVARQSGHGAPEGPRLPRRAGEGKVDASEDGRVKRVPEPEIMDDPRQALAYARADFSEVNQRFADQVLARLGGRPAARVVDLGCGPADIPVRLAAAAPGLSVVGVDASLPMLRLAREAVAGRRLAGRVTLVCARVPALPLPARGFDVVVSNSLLHHLPDPATLWRAVAGLGRPGAVVHVMDLFRPAS